MMGGEIDGASMDRPKIFVAHTWVFESGTKKTSVVREPNPGPLNAAFDLSKRGRLAIR